MKVLVAVAVPGGESRVIGRSIAAALTDRGIAVRLLELDDAHAVPDVDPGSYDAVVLGSAVYSGRWLRRAREFIATHSAALNSRPVWVFSSSDRGVAIYGILMAANPVEHRYLAPGSPDSRPSAVVAWAQEIATATARACDAKRVATGVSTEPVPI